MQYKSEYANELEKLLTKLAKKPKVLHEFLYDILSPSEYKELAVRWQIVKMLNSGYSHREISKTLKVSLATVTRGSREFSNFKGGFRMALKILGKK